MTRPFRIVPCGVVLLGLLTFLPGAASATALAPLQACANGTCLDLSSYLAPSGGDLTTFDANFTLNGSAIHLSGAYDSDPFITFGATTTNQVDGPVTYAFLFGTPIIPGFYGAATSSGTVTFTSAPSGASSTIATGGIYPTYISGYGTVGAVPTNLGVDLGTAPCAGGSTCNQGTASNTFPLTFYDNLEALLTYTQTGTGSVASWTGEVTLTETLAVPEPATLLLFGAGALALMRNRRARARYL
jgi:hypothetical protein